MEILDKTLCQICLSTTENRYFDIFDELQQFESINISEEIFFVTNFKIPQSDTLTKWICEPCYCNLKTAVNFKEFCYKSQKLLLEHDFQEKQTDAEFYDPDPHFNYDVSLQDDIIEEILEEPEIEYSPKNKTPPKKQTSKKEIPRAPQCELCGKICKNMARLRDHKLLAHGGEKSEICPICDKGFILKYQLRRHMEIHSNERKWKCNFGSCDRGFNDPTGLRSHRFICPERSMVIENPHVCEVCHKTFPFPARLKDHMQMYHLGSKKFGCHECDKVFSRPFKLKEHMRIHTGEKPYKCYYCDHMFRVQKHLKPHHDVHHKNQVYIGEGRKINEIQIE